MTWLETDRDIGSAPPGPRITLAENWAPDDAYPSPAGGQKNQSELRAFVPQSVYRAMQVIVQREDTQFGTVSDVVRAAVWHYLKAIQKAIDERHPAVVDTLHREQLRANSEQLTIQHAKLGETLEYIHDSITALLDSGAAALPELERRLAEIDGLVEPLSDYWRGVYREAIDDMAAVKVARSVLNGRAELHSGASPRDAADGRVGTADRQPNPGLPVDTGPDAGDGDRAQAQAAEGSDAGYTRGGRLDHWAEPRYPA